MKRLESQYDELEKEHWRIDRAYHQLFWLWEQQRDPIRYDCLAENAPCEEYESRLNEAWGLLISLQVDLRGYRFDAGKLENPGSLWWKKPIWRAPLQPRWEILKKCDCDHGFPQGLAQSVEAYLEKEYLWNDYLTFIFIDALMFHEVVGFQETLRTMGTDGLPNFRLMFPLEGAFGQFARWSRDLFLVIGDGIKRLWMLAGAAWLYHKDYVEFAIAAAVAWLAIETIGRPLYSIAIGSTPSQKRREKQVVLLGDMMGLYHRFQGDLINPSIFLAHLEQVSREGAIFPQEVFVLLAEAVSRNPRRLRGFREPENFSWHT